MLQIQNTTTVKNMQENYILLANQVKKTGQPVIVLRNNKPDVALVSMKKLEEMGAITLLLQSKEESAKGKSKALKGSISDLWYVAQNN